jgi:hypothetical protein
VTAADQGTVRPDAARRRTRRLLLALTAGVTLLAPARAALAQPAVTVATTCSPDGSATYRLAVTGNEFPPQAPVTVTVTFTAAGGVVDSGGPRTQTTNSDAAGAFTVQQQAVAVGSARAFTVRASGGGTVATATLDVPDCPEGGAAVPVTLSPATGVPGTVVQVTGTGFDPGARLLLRWDRGLGEVTVAVAGDGTFQAALLIFRKDILGPRRLLVEPAGQAPAAPTTTAVSEIAAADATTFLVLPTRQNPALGGAAAQGR